PLLERHGYDVSVERIGYGASARADSGSRGFMVYCRRSSEVARTTQPVEEQVKVYTAAADSILATDKLQAHLRTSLPDYMVPSSFVLIDKLPLLSSGKVDRKRLVEIEAQDLVDDQTHVSPRDELERVLAKIFAEVLGLARVGVNDDFFKLGGHSLLAAQVISRILEKLNIEFPLQRFFERSTVASCAEWMRSSGTVRAEALDPIVRVDRSAEQVLLERIDQLSDEEVREMLDDIEAQDRRKR